MDRNPNSPWNPQKPLDVSPAEFEQQVLSWLKNSAPDDSEFRAEHQGTVTGLGGDYSIDVLIHWTIFKGASLEILVECKHQKRPVERDEVIILEGKLRDAEAHKGMLFSTSGFQKGAIKYAEAHGIATVTFVERSWLYETRAIGPTPEPPPWLSGFAGIRLSPTQGGLRSHMIDDESLDALVEWLEEAKRE